MADQASTVAAWQAMAANVQAIGGTVPTGIAVGDTIEITVLSGIRTLPGTAQPQQTGGNEPLGSRAVVTVISPITDGELWYQGTWSGSGRTGYVRASRVAEVAAGPAPIPAPTISGFSATPGTINAGQQTTLNATVANAVTLTLNGVVIPGLPQVDMPTVTRTYTLVATGAAGTTPATSSLTVTVAVTQPPPPPVGGSLAANTARNLGTYIPAISSWGASKEAKRTDYSTIVSLGNGLVAFVGGGHGGAQMGDLRILNVATGQWSSPQPSIAWSATTEANLDRVRGCWLVPNQMTARHTYNNMVYATALNRLYIMTRDGMVDNTVDSVAALGGWSGRISWYDFGSGQWGFSQQPNTPWVASSSAAYDPISGKILVIGPTAPNVGIANGFWLYDPTTDAAPLFVAKTGWPVNGGAQDLVYVPTNDRFYSVMKSGGNIYEIALNRATPTATTALLLATTGPRPPAIGYEPVGYACDPVNGIIGGHVVNGVFYAFHIATRVWSARTMQYEGAAPSPLPTQVFHCLDFDAASGWFVFLENSAARKTTWAYRYG